MLQSLVDLTIVGSSCIIFYKDLKGVVSYKCYKRISGDGHYINGDAYKDNKGKYINNIFKVTNIKAFKRNLNQCYVP